MRVCIYTLGEFKFRIRRAELLTQLCNLVLWSWNISAFAFMPCLCGSQKTSRYIANQEFYFFRSSDWKKLLFLIKKVWLSHSIAILDVTAHFFVGFALKTLSWIETWLILPVVICLSQRLSHACLGINLRMVKLRMAHENSCGLSGTWKIDG